MISSVIAPLFLPATRLERLARAGASGADALILDLEDAVAAADKTSARAGLAGMLSTLPVILRINAIGTAWHAEDLAAAIALRVDAILLPKAEPGTELTRFCADTAGIAVMALVESAEGIAGAREIARTPGVQRMAFGSIDYCADLGCDHIPEALLSARSELVLAARLARQTAPLDGVTVNTREPELAGEEARAARALGMGGKLLIHPTQVNPVLAAFRPGAAEIERALRIMAVPEGVATLDGEMIDAPVRLRAARILAAAGRAPIATER